MCERTEGSYSLMIIRRVAVSDMTVRNMISCRFRSCRPIIYPGNDVSMSGDLYRVRETYVHSCATRSLLCIISYSLFRLLQRGGSIRVMINEQDSANWIISPTNGQRSCGRDGTLVLWVGITDGWVCSPWHSKRRLSSVLDISVEECPESITHDMTLLRWETRLKS